MKTIELNKNSWIFKLWKSIYIKDEYSPDGCKLGWELILLPLVLIVGLPIHAIHIFIPKRNRFSGPTASLLFVGLLAHFVIFGVGLAVFCNIYTGAKATALNFTYGYILGIPTSIIIYFIVIGIGRITENICYNLPENKKRESFIKTWIKAKKEKSCPQINWK